MSNDVRNQFSIEGSKKHKEKLSIATDHLIKALEKDDLDEVLWSKGEMVDPEHDGRTIFTDEYGSEFTFRSAWGPCNSVHDKICWILHQIDPLVVVENQFMEEFGQSVGSRIVTIENGKIISYRKDYDISDEISEIRDSCSEEDFSDQDEEADEFDMEDDSEEKVDELIESKIDLASAKVRQLLIKKLPNRKSLIRACHQLRA